MPLGSKTITVLGQLMTQARISELTNMQDFLKAYNYSQEVQRAFDRFERHMVMPLSGSMVRTWGETMLHLEVERETSYIPRSELERFVIKLTEDILNEILNPQMRILQISYENYLSQSDIDRLLRFLEVDGYTYSSGKIVPIEFQNAETAEIRSILFSKIQSHTELDSKVLIYHLEQCEQNYVDRHWKDCIAHGRNLVEQLLQNIAESAAKLRKENPTLKKPVEVRDYLVSAGFFDLDERKKLVDGVYGYLSDEGSHPGISDDEAARVSRNVMLSFAFYLLEKFETWKKNNYRKL